jgi:hypothetical protein
MNDVMKAIDRSDLVIADLVDVNPNAMYELAICHALGIPTLVVMGDRLPFDTSAYRAIEIDLDNASEAQRILRPHLAQVIDDINHRVIPNNPITNFYREPITSISPAAGLAQGYFHNFIKPVVERLRALTPEQDEHLYDIGLVKTLEGVDGERSRVVNFIGKSVEKRWNIKLHIIIPDRIQDCRENSIAPLKRGMEEAIIQFGRLQHQVMARRDDDIFQLYDVPTPMAVMDPSITKRAGLLGEPDRDSATWRDIERSEINRFFLELLQWIRGHSKEFQSRVEIVRFSREKSYDDKFAWLYQIWG